MKLYPTAKRTIGPAIENGFYFDFDFGDIKISDADLPKIEKTMSNILQGWKTFEKHELSPDDAKKEYPGNEFKHELIDEFSGKGEILTFYKSGEYWDLCRGGHCEHPSKELRFFKLLSVAGAYWRGNEKNKMLTRIYGTCFA
jgi:threonyl-tRNA synthetase